MRTKLFAALRSVDPSTWLILFGVLLRCEVLLRSNIEYGYDSLNHMAYTDWVAQGRFPRIGDTDLGRAAFAASHPPLYYGCALALEKLGLGRWGGALISLVAGAGRLILADRLMKRGMGLDPRARFIANAIHVVIPFALRVDVFYSNESLATTLALAAIVLSLKTRPVSSGLALGAAFLTKATAVAAVPAIVVGAFTHEDGRFGFDNRQFRRLVLVGVLSGLVLLPWSLENLRRHKTPYPGAYHPSVISELKTHPHLFTGPLWERHKPEWFFPRFAWREIGWPYSKNVPTLWNALYLEAWSDHYNYLRPEGPATMNGNQKPLTRRMYYTHVAFAAVGLPFMLAMFAGLYGALRRFFRRQMGRTEVVIGTYGLSALFIAILYATWIPLDYHGAVKATYALGSVVILSAWTGRALAALVRGRRSARAVYALTALPIIVTLWQRVVW